jgi:hypothetical protein
LSGWGKFLIDELRAKAFRRIFEAKTAGKGENRANEEESGEE